MNNIISEKIYIMDNNGLDTVENRSNYKTKMNNGPRREQRDKNIKL